MPNEIALLTRSRDGNSASRHLPRRPSPTRTALRFIVATATIAPLWTAAEAIAAPDKPGTAPSTSVSGVVAPSSSLADLGRADAVAKEMLGRLKAGGLTADVAAKRALATSRTAKVDEAKLRVAAAQLDDAMNGYFPRLSFLARYTRLSPITAPNLGTIVTARAAGPITADNPLFAVPFSFPVILDSFTTQATLLIPISDYVLRTYKNQKSFEWTKTALEYNAKASAAQLIADTKTAFYNVLRARGAIIVSKAAVAQAKGHLKDVKTGLDLKIATLADVARVEAQVAAAEFAVIRSENLTVVTEEILRTYMHAPAEESLDLGEDLEGEVGRLALDLPTLRSTALSKRPEIMGIEAQIESLTLKRGVVSASLYPRFDAIGNVTYANPNNRFQPATGNWNLTWDVSLQLTWSPNDYLSAGTVRREFDANIAQIRATREQIEDGLRLEVLTAWQQVRNAEAGVISNSAERRATEEELRVRIIQFKNGLAVSALLLDAESDLTRARLNELNTRCDLRIAHVLLKKAMGELF